MLQAWQTTFFVMLHGQKRYDKGLAVIWVFNDLDVYVVNFTDIFFGNYIGRAPDEITLPLSINITRSEKTEAKFKSCSTIITVAFFLQ
jgi:hypothetical protein